ncbi:MAG: VOC family protein [Ignavibacteria bacterium]|nr:VOC family protein [Ignavibacteria bacterium]
MKSLKLKSLKILSGVFIAAILTASNGCGSAARYPAVSETQTKTYNTGQVVWRDLVTPDPKKAADFYKKVFGWTVESNGNEDNPYWVFKNNGKRIAGMFEMTDAKSDAGGEWLSYVSVPSVENAASKTKSAGGVVMREPVDMEGRGMVSLLSDPQKAIFAVIKSNGGDPAVREAVANEWLWTELWSTNPEKSGQYYKDLLGANIEEKTIDERTYRVIDKDSRRCAGIIQNPAESSRSHWLQYIKVSDVQSTLQKARDAGAKVLIEPNEKIRKGSVAVLMDPTGAPFAIQLWPYN